MKITETRKAIIKLIEPYMDKTLSEGCLLNIKPDGTASCKWIYKLIYYRNFYTWMSAWIEKIILKQGGVRELSQRTDEWRWNWYDFEELWHYDITAVLKFIKSKWDYTIEFHENFIWIVWKIDYTIPNKPLHLFTEEQDKELLGILE